MCAVSAQDCENETRKLENCPQDLETIKISAENTVPVKANPAEEKLESTVTKEKVELKSSNVNMYYKDGTKFTVTMKDKNKKAISNVKVKITVSGKTYTQTTDKKGSTSLNINLKSGTYDILTNFDGTDRYEKQSIKNTIKIKSTIKCGDLKKIYKNSAKYSSTFYDKKGKILKNTAMRFKICNKIYTVKTDKNGIGRLNINLKPGKYSISLINTKTSETITKTITILSLINENNNLIKYYGNSKEYKVKIIDSNGKSAGSGKQVTFNINGASYKKITDKNGYAKINVNLKPGTYTIKTSYGGCVASNTITIKNLIETKDLTMNHEDGQKFSVRILNSQGNPAANQKVALKTCGKTYTKTTGKNGMASLDINLEPGSYDIITEYGNLKVKNKIKVNRVIKTSDFIHTTLIPNYVNVTIPYVFHNSAYSLKTGFNGIVKMPKNEVFSIEVGSKCYVFTTGPEIGLNYYSLEYKSYLIPFNGESIKSDINKDNLKGNGILISKTDDYTQIDYIGKTTDNTELFGFYADKGMDYSETIKYMQNDKITAKITFATQSFDDYGVRYSLAKYYGKNINFKYSELKDKNLIKFVNTNESVTFSYFESYIVGYTSKEDMTTKFKINGKEELEKHETISYGLAKTYRSNFEFEVLQSYAIINEKITKDIMNKWVSKNPNYINRFGVMNVYGMFLASLECCWLADDIANSYSKTYNVNWKRSNTLTIMGGINLEDTYLNILNADMGMKVTGNNNNVISFRLLNSLCLPYLEEYALMPISERYRIDITNSLDNVLHAVEKNNYSTVKLEDYLYVFAEDGTNSAIVLNCTSGVAHAIINQNGSVYKGSSVSTSKDCCSVGIIPKDIITYIKEIGKHLSPAVYLLSDEYQKIHPFSKIANYGLTYILGKTLSGLSGTVFSAYAFMNVIQAGGSMYRDNMLDEKDWHSAMDTFTFTRPGYFQGKKVYNIPKGNGQTDYVEVKINSDLSLDRNSAIYISNGNVKQLTKSETYQYFCEDYWTPFSVSTKYWDKSWKGG